MIRVKGRYRFQKIELDLPLDLPEGTEIEIGIRAFCNESSEESEDWSELGMDRLKREWDNPKDAIYDDWRKLYGVPDG